MFLHVLDGLLLPLMCQCVRVSLSGPRVFCLSVVVTYKKRAKANNNNSSAPRRPEGAEDEMEGEEELTSGQFGITDPEDEGKWLIHWMRRSW